MTVKTAIVEPIQSPHIPAVASLGPRIEGTHMNAEERQLITDLFERLRSVGQIDKDRDAEALIISYARQNADAGYLLVQNVLVQEHLAQQQALELQSMQARIEELEAMVPRQAPKPQAAGNGGFLGGMFGGRPAAPQSVPVSRPAPTYTQASSPWGNRSAAPQQGGQAPYQPPAYQPQPQQAPAGGGGFMRSAMGMAAGVAGGMLAANAISNMMKGNSPSGNSPAQASGGDLGSNDPAINDASGYNNSGDAGGTYATQEPITDDNNDPGTYTESNDSGDSGGETEY
jgi:uncharacterized protein